jgi:hypothetical protein
VTGGWFPPGPPVPTPNKTDRHDIADILLKVALNTIKLQTSVCIDIYDSGDSCKFNYHTITTTTAPQCKLKKSHADVN